MNLLEIWHGGVALITEMADTTDVSGEEKLARLAEKTRTLGENMDDLVGALPGHFGDVAKLAVDNPLSDNEENTRLWLPFAEMLYQLWKLEQKFVKNLPGASA